MILFLLDVVGKFLTAYREDAYLFYSIPISSVRDVDFNLRTATITLESRPDTPCCTCCQSESQNQANKDASTMCCSCWSRCKSSPAREPWWRKKAFFGLRWLEVLAIVLFPIII